MRLNYSFFLLPSLLLSCKHKDPPPPPVDFIFQVPLTVTPTQTTYSVGDTLWISADFSDQLPEFTSKTTYPVTPDNFDIKTGIGIRRLTASKDNFSDLPGAVSSFRFISKIGNIEFSGPTFGGLSYLYFNKKYFSKIGLIPLNTGFFILNFYNGWGIYKPDRPWPDLSYINLPVDSNGQPQHAKYLTTLYYVNDGQNNFNLLDQNLQLNLSNNSDLININYVKEATYTFNVK